MHFINKLPLLLSAIILLTILTSCKQQQKDQKHDYPIQPVPFTAVKLTDDFWAPRIKINHEVTIPIAFQKSRETGRIKNFKVAGGLEEGSFCSIYPFDDSDVFKIIEGASYSLQTFPDPDLEAYLDSLIFYISEAQEEDGYLYTNRTILGDSAHKWAGENRWDLVHELSHELYNLGHMFEAAVAHYQATGKSTFLNVAIKAADLVDRDFGPGKISRVPGHQEIEIGLVKLYRVTGEQRYLDLAKFFLDMRGPGGPQYSQAHKKVVDQDEAVGHAVRAVYMYSAMADIAALTGDKQYMDATGRIWRDVVYGKYYVTGGIGSSRHGEAFGEPYQLPNLTAYCETCAAVANVFWNYRLFLLQGESKYYDVLERTLYNGLISGVSLSGDRFFYPNPLESHADYERSPWFGCACCPSNITRFIPSLPGYMYAVDQDKIYVNLFIEGHADIDLQGKHIEIDQQTSYPWDGLMEISVSPEKPVRFDLMIRIPGWAVDKPVPGELYHFDKKYGKKATLFVNDEEAEYRIHKGYAVLGRKWRKGDRVRLELDMPVRKVLANQKVTEDTGKLALQRGPLVYCVEGTDNNGQVFNITLNKNSDLEPHYNPDMLNGIYLLQGQAQRILEDKNGNTQTENIILSAIPYYSWANRGPAEMVVWIPY